MWGWLKRNAGKIVGAAIGGPIGLIIGALLDEYIKSREKAPILPHILEEVDAWEDEIVKPIALQFLTELGSTPQSELNSKTFIDKFNLALKNLAALKAYFEFLRLKSTHQEELAKYDETIARMGLSMEIFHKSFLYATGGSALPYVVGPISFNATSMSNVGTEYFNWTGAKLITAIYEGYSLPISGGTTKPGGGTVITKPPITTKPGGGTTIITKPPITKPSLPPVQTNPKPGSSNEVPVNNFKPLPINVTTTTKNNKNKWIVGIALAAAAFFYFKKE